MLGIDVLTHFGERRSDEVDLYLPDLELAIELDPFISHKGKTEKDRTRLAYHKGRLSQVVRFRDARLDSIPECPEVPDNANSLNWAKAIAAYILPDGYVTPSEDETTRALQTAADKFLRLLGTPPHHNLTEAPHLLEEFVANLDLPGQAPEWISLGSGALCLWRCPKGLHDDYTQYVYHRTGKQRVGCPPCGRARIAAARRAPVPGCTAADVAPEAEEYFVRNDTAPGASLMELRPGSRDMCLWRCGICSSEFLRQLKDYIDGAGACPDCRYRQAWATRRESPLDRTNTHFERGLDELMSFIGTHGHCRIAEGYVTESEFKLGVWVKRIRKADLTDEQLASLAQVPGWSATPKQDAWDHGYERLTQYVEREGHALVPAAHREATDDYGLGYFVRKQRAIFRLGSLPADRKAALEAVPGWRWRLRRERSDAGRPNGRRKSREG
ncbi:Helicase associated domain protein [Ornithinimicrobium sp. W1679]|uniref:Helicase associated domain protein n=1 Tax=Ornithinimicrobium sp. W1679 TaxID=3418770 RepID=UPI003CF74EF8